MNLLLAKLASVTLPDPSRQPLLDAITAKAKSGWYEGRTEELAKELRALGDAKLPDEPFAAFIEACNFAVYNADQRDTGVAARAGS